MTSVVIDLDDVLIPLSDTIFNRYRLDINKFTSYKISRCTLSDEEKSLILKSYGDVDIFKSAGLYTEAYKAIELLQNLVTDNKVEVFINSNSYNHEVADYKLDLLHKEMSFLPDENICFNVGLEGLVDSKRIKACDIIIEDYINNIYTAESYKYAFLINKTHNMNIHLPSNIIRQQNIYEAVKYIRCLVDSNMN